MRKFNIKRLTTFLLILLVCFFLSCKTSTESDEEILEEYVNSISYPEVLTSNLDLNEKVTFKSKEITISYKSDNESILTNEGKLQACTQDHIVSLSVLYTLNNAHKSMVYEFIVTKMSVDDYLSQALENLNIPSSIESPAKINLEGFKMGDSRVYVKVKSANSDIITDEGDVLPCNNDTKVSVTLTLSVNNSSKDFTKEITVLKTNKEDLKNALKGLNYNESYETDIALIYTVDFKGHSYPVTYTSSNESILKNNGKVIPQNTEVKVKLTAKTILDVTYEFEISILPLSDETCINLASKNIYIPNVTSNDIYLPTSLDYGVSCVWSSSNTNILDNTGKITNAQAKYIEITLKLTLRKGDTTVEKEFKTNVRKEDHSYLDRSFEGTLTNLCIEDGALVLEAGKLEGSYVTKEIETHDFTEIVCSFAGLTSKEATAELMVRVKSNDKWSKYFTYGPWGQGLQNACYSQDDTYFRMREDEILANNSNVGKAFQIKIVLKRNSVSAESPKIKLLAAALNFVSYTYDVDISNLPKEVKYDVPKLYQQIVPNIGGIICSATTSAMLLKYKGHNFEGLATYEHEYIASIVLDSGNDIYGNWVYNTIGMSSFGEIAYVKRFINMNEIYYYLANVGPMGASIKGYVINGVKDYNTAGHLMVVTGYRFNDDGTKVLYINDPNVPSVAVEMTEANFIAINRFVSYVIE